MWLHQERIIQTLFHQSCTMGWDTSCGLNLEILGRVSWVVSHVLIQCGWWGPPMSWTTYSPPWLYCMLQCHCQNVPRLLGGKVSAKQLVLSDTWYIVNMNHHVHQRIEWCWIQDVGRILDKTLVAPAMPKWGVDLDTMYPYPTPSSPIRALHWLELMGWDIQRPCNLESSGNMETK
jgi:hypothetical protein